LHILMLTTNDPAGTAIAFTKAINRHTGHSCRLVTTEIRYNFYFEKDLHLPALNREGIDEIEALLKGADVIHFHMLADERMELGPLKVKDYLPGKKIVHHHHGHPHFRANPALYREKYARNARRVLVSTPDLLRLLPEAVWQPNLVPLFDPLFMPRDPGWNGTARIGHAPTRKELKNTRELLQAVGELKQRPLGCDVVLDVIENCLYRECLKRKNRCHVIFDHMQGYYGVSSLESLSQGKPVIAGLDAWNRRHIEDFAGTVRLPWVIVHTQDELRDALERYIVDCERRERTGRYSREFMENGWSEQRVLDRLVGFYASL
jgi:hypothetical protein